MMRNNPTKAYFLFLLFICFGKLSHAQHYVGFLFSADLSYVQKDKLFNPYIMRKLGIGISFSNSQGDFIGYMGFGFKGWKASLKDPKFTDGFKN